MKIRSGFVSNSSSASYMVNTVNINRIALHMLDIIIENWESWSSSSKKDRERRNKLRTNLTNIYNDQGIKDGKMGITMPSTNYDTYLIVKGKRIYISTCNNHDFNFYDFVSCSYSGGGADAEDEVHQIITKANFYNIENGIIHCYPYYPEDISENSENEFYCKKCKKMPFSIVETLDGIMLCSECYKSLGKSPKKELEEIKKKQHKSMSAFKYLEP